MNRARKNKMRGNQTTCQQSNISESETNIYAIKYKNALRNVTNFRFLNLSTKVQIFLHVTLNP